MMDQIVRHTVFATLAKEYPGGVPVDLTDMMNIVVVNEVVFVDVLGAGTITAQQNTATAHGLDMVA